MRHQWSILCTRSIVDDTTKNISLLDVIDEVQLRPAEPVTPERALLVPVQWAFVTTWMRSDVATPEGVLQQRLRLLEPQGATMFEGAPVDINLQDFIRMRSIALIQELLLPREGAYYFVIESRPGADAPWTEVGRVPLIVRFEAPVPAP